MRTHRIIPHPVERFYLPRRTAGGADVFDVMPFEGAAAYVLCDYGHGEADYGILNDDGSVDVLGSASQAFGDGLERVELID